MAFQITKALAAAFACDWYNAVDSHTPDQNFGCIFREGICAMMTFWPGMKMISTPILTDGTESTPWKSRQPGIRLLFCCISPGRHGAGRRRQPTVKK